MQQNYVLLDVHDPRQVCLNTVDIFFFAFLLNFDKLKFIRSSWFYERLPRAVNLYYHCPHHEIALFVYILILTDSELQ